MPSHDLIRLLLEIVLGGGCVAALWRLHVERKLRAAQVESASAGADKYRAEAHRSDIETMAVVVRSVRERYVELERERDELRGRVEQLEALAREITAAGKGRGRLLE